MQRFLALAFVAGAAQVLCAQGYSTDFEAPAFTGSAAGTLLTGQDGFYLAPVAGSIDWNVHTYAGNPYGVPANPLGGSQFIACQSQGGTALGRAQRPQTFTSNTYWRWSFDFCGNFLGAAPPAAEYIGSFSLQPSTTNANFNILLSWGANTTAPVLFNIATQVYNAAGTAQAIAPVPDPAWQNLPVNQWYRMEWTWDFATNRVIQGKLTDLTTFTTATFNPPPDWYLLGGAAGAPLPTDFRFFAGGATAGNVFAADNFAIEPQQYFSYGAGCAGALGAPHLDALPGTEPDIGTTFVARVSNMPGPAGFGIFVAGFSNTTFGTFTLPLDLTPFGLTGCNLLTSQAVSEVILSSGGIATWGLSIPNNPAFTGTVLFNQAFVYDPPANPAGLTTTNGRRMNVL